MSNSWMHKVKDYNMKLRQEVLVCSIRVEEMASEVLKNLLRTIRPKSKTLGNQSSSLSFKNKIDLLYDLGDFSKEEYSDFIKFMEIRNQFIHNPDCVSFEYMVKEISGFDKFLMGNIPAHIDISTAEAEGKKLGVSEAEVLYRISFKTLFIKVLAKLITKRVEYSQGMTEEMYRFIDARVLNDFTNVFKDALELWRKSQPTQVPFMLRGMNSVNVEAEIITFENDLSIAILDNKIKALDYIIETESIEKEVFKRRTDIEEKLANAKKKN